MAFTKKTWVTGETITAEALNRVEQGVGDAHAALPQLGAVYSGVIGEGGVPADNLPSGWSVSHVPTGVYTITHGLAIAAQERFVILCTAREGSGGYVRDVTFAVHTVGSNSFVVDAEYELGLLDTAFSFIVIVLPA